MANVIRRQTLGARISRAAVYSVLILAALFYLLPLIVMLITSVKPLSEISPGTLLTLPQDPTLAPWAKAWGEACTGMRCEGVGGYFWNSFAIVIPAVLISTMIGALNGYSAFNLLDHIFFAAVTYTTVGYGDIYATGPIRFLYGTLALTGFVLITWSASFTFVEMQKHWRVRK